MDTRTIKIEVVVKGNITDYGLQEITHQVIQAGVRFLDGNAPPEIADLVNILSFEYPQIEKTDD